MVNGVLHSASMPSIGYAITASQSGKMSLPVSPAVYIYSHFEHVAGVPAPDGTRGVPINRLKVLDVLISQLAEIKKRPNPAPVNGEAMSDQQIDALIDKYEGQIRQAQAQAVAMPYRAAPSAPTGMLFNIGI